MPISAMLAADLLLALEALPELCSAAVAGVRAAVRQRDIAVHEGPDALEKATPAWRALEYAGSAATAFQTFDVARACAQAHIAQGDALRIVTVHENGKAMVLMPTMVGRTAGISTVRFLGDPFIQYGDALVSPDAQQRHIETAWKAAADPSVASAILLRKVRADARLATVLHARASAVAEHAAPFVDLRTDRAACRDARRSARRLAQAGEVSFAVSQAREADVREALDLKRAWLDAQGLTSSVIGNPVWETVLLRLARSAKLSAARLMVRGELAATEIAMVKAGVWTSYLGAIAPDFARCGPGKVQIAHALAHGRARGLDTYDLLAPAQPYKTAIATGAVTVRDYVAPLDPLGRLALVAMRSAPEIRSQIERLPLALRRFVLGFARI